MNENTQPTAVAVKTGADTQHAMTVTQNMTPLQVCQNMANITALGKIMALSGFFGKCTEAKATAHLINCFLEGKTPLQYKGKYHLHEDGQTSIRSDYIQREFHKMGGKWRFVEWTADKCDMVFDHNGETLPFCVTLEEFKENGVACRGDGKTLKDNWHKFPREMLKARCMATAIRALCPEALEGMYTQEEVADLERPAPAPTAVKVSPSPIAATATEQTPPTDAHVCPCGSVKDKRWEELPTDTLVKILETPADKAPALTDAHRNAIIDELVRREAAEADTVEAEVVEK